jgi:hypothetical protein
MPTTAYGRTLGVERNGIFTSTNTDPIRPFGRLWTPAAAAWNDMRLHIGVREGHWIAPAGNASHARPVGRRGDGAAPGIVYGTQWYFWETQPPPAAWPGSSNHGWGIAVDVHHPKDALYIRKHGSRFGWSHDEGARVGEWWHFRYIGPYRSPYLALAEDERRWLYELRTLKAQKHDKPRQQVLVRVCEQRRRTLRRLAPLTKTGPTAKARRRRARMIARVT